MKRVLLLHSPIRSIFTVGKDKLVAYMCYINPNHFIFFTIYVPSTRPQYTTYHGISKPIKIYYKVRVVR